MNAFPVWAALYSMLNGEQRWMVQAASAVLLTGVVIGAAWTLWDIGRPLAGYVWWSLRDLAGLKEEPQPESPLAGVTIVRDRLAPKRERQSLLEPARLVSSTAPAGSDLLGLKADVS